MKIQLLLDCASAFIADQPRKFIQPTGSEGWAVDKIQFDEIEYVQWVFLNI